MAKVFKDCDEEVYEIAKEIIDTYRGDLAASGASIKFLWVYDTKGQPALKKNGHQVVGMAKVNNLQDKMEGKTDATILLDMEFWESYSPMRRRALVHHELCHIGWDRGKFDALMRPALHTIPGDWENDGFNVCVELYGEDSCERRWLNSVEARLSQATLFPEKEADLAVAAAPGVVIPQAPPRPIPPSRDSAKEGEPDVVRDTFAALLSVGYSEAQARAAIDQVLDGGEVFAKVTDLIDAIYRQRSSNEKTSPLAPPEAWREMPIDVLVEHGLAVGTVAFLGQRDIEQLGELIAFGGSRAPFLDGLQSEHLAEALERFGLSLLAHQKPSFDEALAQPPVGQVEVPSPMDAPSGEKPVDPKGYPVPPGTPQPRSWEEPKKPGRRRAAKAANQATA